MSERKPTSREHAQTLQQTVQGHLGSRVLDLEITIKHGGVELRGRSYTYHAKQLAQHAAMTASQLPIVANHIQVIRT